MLRHVIFAALVPAAAMLSSCNDIICRDGNGSVGTEERTVGAFHSIEIDGSANVEVRQGSERSLVVEAETNIIPLITTNVVGGVLTIDSRECYSANRPVVVKVTMPEVRALTVDGSGSFSTVGSITAESLRLLIDGSGDINVAGTITSTDALIDGSGDITLRGTGTHARFEIDGSGDIRAFDFPVDTCTVEVGGSGDVEVNVAKKLVVHIGGSGDVTYTGPVTDVQTTIDGSGNVRRR